MYLEAVQFKIKKKKVCINSMEDCVIIEIKEDYV